MMSNYMQQVPMMYPPVMPGYMPQGHFNPAMVFRQAIFQQPVYGMPTQTPEGYSYSSTYLQQQQQEQQAQQQFHVRPQPVATSSKVVLDGPRPDPSSSRPSKRPRPNPTSTATPPPPSSLPSRTKIPLRKGQSESTQGFWRNCSSPGCAYVGPEKEVRVHEGDRHLIFKDTKVGKVSEEEEEEAARKVGG